MTCRFSFAIWQPRHTSRTAHPAQRSPCQRSPVAVAGCECCAINQKGKKKYATAHDFRSAFGERWALRVMPPVLMQLMRHESIETTMRFYVGRSVQATADVVWEAYEQGKGAPEGIRERDTLRDTNGLKRSRT